MSGKLWRALTRRKTEDLGREESKLARVLNLFDLTLLSVGATLGLGIYVLAGEVAKDVAGPAVIISLFIAALSSIFAGLCYAELGGRVPKAGSSYVYSYVTIGEFIAFTIGWNLILEYVISTASIARGFSIYFDSIIDHKMSLALKEWLPMNIPNFSTYPDILAFSMIAFLTALLAFGMRESSTLNNILTGVNLTTIVVIIVAGIFYAQFGYWNIPLEEVPKDKVASAGAGGFMPFGVTGVMAGAAKCFMAFSGFDGIATTGEETLNPKRTIPLAIITSLFIIYIAYFGVATALTLMVPYYDLNKDEPFPSAFEYRGLYGIKWVVTIGAAFALSAALLGALFPLPRILYSMGDDGIIFKIFKSVHPHYKTPLFATVVSGMFAAAMSLFFNLDGLLELTSMATLVAYTIVCINVLVLRYHDNHMRTNTPTDVTFVLRQFYNGHSYFSPNYLTSCITKVGTASYCVVTVIWCLVERFWTLDTTHGAWTCGILGGILFLIFAIIGMQPASSDILSFRVPLVPLIPCLSIFINIYLMLKLQDMTMLMFLLWLIMGYTIYFGYGIKHSEQIERDRNLLNAVIGHPRESKETHQNETFKMDDE